MSTSDPARGAAFENPYVLVAPQPHAATPLLIHIPHSSTRVTTPWREAITFSDAALRTELLAMTDRYTDELFAPAARTHGGTAFINQHSRLVFDPERFEDDAREPMAAIGMGAVYTRTSSGGELRGRDFSAAEREAVLAHLFRPYATALTSQVARQLDRFDRCLIIDAHSFPAVALPYEDPTRERPDLCIGYEADHAPPTLVHAIEQVAQRHGWSVRHNEPFAGSYVPLDYYRRDRRVTSVMLKLNRALYMDERTGERLPGFPRAVEQVGELVDAAVLFEAFRNTRFHASLPSGEICIRDGQRCAELDRFLREEGATSWAYVTAYNPDGKPALASANELAQARLRREAEGKGFAVVEGEGRADVGDWPPEPSLLIVGIGRAEAAALGERFGQAEIVVGESGQAAELVPLV